MLTAVADQAIAESIPVHERTEALALIHEGGRCYGAIVRDLITGELRAYVAKATAIATGGAGRIYRNTTNAVISEGIGNVIAMETGQAALGNMEAVQFHPTAIFPAGILMTEGCRGDGGLLKDVDGHRFMPDYEPEKKELASRDVVSRRMEEHIRKGKAARSRFGEHLWLDITQLGEPHIKRNLREVWEICHYFLGIDPVREMIPVRPAQHYTMGGVRTKPHRREPDAEGPLRGGRGGVLGHARLQPAGRQLGGRDSRRRQDRRRIHRRLLRQRGERREHSHGADPRVRGARAGKVGRHDPAQRRRGRERDQTADAGSHERQGRHFPHRAELDAGSRRAAEAARAQPQHRAPLPHSPGTNPELVTAYRVQKMLKLALTVAHGAQVRTESRGAHFRQDFPRRDDAQWLKRTLATWTSESDTLPTLAYEPIDVKRMELPPGWRGYGAKDYIDHPDTPGAAGRGRRAEGEALRRGSLRRAAGTDALRAMAASSPARP